MSEFLTRLRALGVKPRRSEPWLMVGKPRHVAGWKLHVSATVTGVELLFERVLPYLAQAGVPFKVAAGRDAIVQLGAGTFGEVQMGKVITIYPRHDTEAVALAGELIVRTRRLDGPRIATDLHLGEAIYARYGAVCPRVAHDRFGEPVELIPDGDGNWVPDRRQVPFTCPPGIAIPFPTAAVAEIPAPPRRRTLLGGRYFVTDVVRPGIAGSVLRAIDLRHTSRPTAWVLKQARPHCSTDERGRDWRVRLRHEGAVIRRLRGLTGIVPAAQYFEEEGCGYLPVAYVSGVSLGELVNQVVAGRSWMSVSAPTRRRLLGYAAQLIRRMCSAHARAVIHRDIAPGNVWIGDDGRVYLLDWECAHIVGSRSAPFQLGTAGFSDLSRTPRTPGRRDDWQACLRVLAFMFTGLDPTAFIHGRSRELQARLAELTGLRDTRFIELVARALVDESSIELDGPTWLRALGSLSRGGTARRRLGTAPLYTATAHESVLEEGMTRLSAQLRERLDRLKIRRAAVEAAAIDAHSGIAGLLYVLAAAHGARGAPVDVSLCKRAVAALTAQAAITPDLPGLVHGCAGRALAIAAALQAGCVSHDELLYARLADALAGRLDWPDFTHGAAGQGFAALACAQRLAIPRLAHRAAACAHHLVRTQDRDGAWALPKDGPDGGERYTGFAHGTAGMMGFLGAFAATTCDAAADTAWRRAETWLISRARRGRGGRWLWPRSDSHTAPGQWWCHGAPGIALGWLCVARAQGRAAIAEQYLLRALYASQPKMRSDSFSQCHGMAGVGEVYLDAHQVLEEETWRERASDIAQALVSLFRSRWRQPWHYLREEPAASADGLMLGSAGILHFLLRHRYPAAVASPPLLR